MDRMAYTWWRYANVTVNSLVNRRFVNINWAPGPPAPAPENRRRITNAEWRRINNVPWADRPLRAGLP
eukprot:3772950-Pleurochrysis_carterae.AAC.1